MCVVLFHMQLKLGTNSKYPTVGFKRQSKDRKQRTCRMHNQGKRPDSRGFLFKAEDCVKCCPEEQEQVVLPRGLGALIYLLPSSCAAAMS